MSKFPAKLTPAGFSFNLVADNNGIIATSQGYKAKASCLNGIESVRANAPWAETVAEDVYAEKVIYGNFYTVDKQ